MFTFALSSELLRRRRTVTLPRLLMDLSGLPVTSLPDLSMGLPGLTSLPELPMGLPGSDTRCWKGDTPSKQHQQQTDGFQFRHLVEKKKGSEDGIKDRGH
ncbi:uncharacterized protein LOC127794168 isoform X2 [Diospyros lotus]|uniref:uncharacterized protein LOC127794168 isoform X2 n=1 Tax=Diospyros lotus TaxID=55363 RepID=UPI00224F6F6C|nr:uncharacterized protein LOC127794168 isoform X2 [Diospyros lotus]